MHDASTKLTLTSVGPLRVVDPQGEDLTPRSQKARGLLALLAMSPGHRRARSLLQDKLWSDRGPEQGAASLRQTLTEIRRAFGRWSNAFVCDRTMIALDPNFVRIVGLGQLDDRQIGEGTGEFVLFEGLEVRDPEFEDWLRDRRSEFETELCTRRAKLLEAPVPIPVETSTKPPALAATRSVLAPEMVLGRIRGAGSLVDEVMARAVTDLAGKLASETTSVSVIDQRDDPDVSPLTEASPNTAIVRSPAITAEIAREPGQSAWRLVVVDPAAKRLIWSAVGQQSGHLDLDDPDLLRGLNQTVDVAVSTLICDTDRRDAKTEATRLCQAGIRRLVLLGKDNLDAADDLFARAFECDPRGIYLAWRAYLRSYLFAERLFTCRETTIEEALGFMRRAIELEPANSFVSSFGAHVHTVIRRSYIAAIELAQRSLELNRANPMAWACLGIAECHLGQAKSGFERTLVARKIAGTSPLRFQIDALSCIAGAMAGDIESAIHCGESSNALAPTFAPPLRYMAALYLLHGDRERSHEKVASLVALEPDFTYDLLRDRSYPAAGLHRSNLLSMLPRREI